VYNKHQRNGDATCSTINKWHAICSSIKRKILNATRKFKEQELEIRAILKKIWWNGSLKEIR
jgi:hypothetical protein